MDNEQRKLSEQLQLLNELQYSDPRRPYQGPRTHESHDSDANREVRLLDAFAVALTTGKSGEVFAVAFDKREKLQLVLAKSGPPTPDDMAAAEELICLIGSPAVADAMQLFPFLIRRCGANIDKRIRNLHISIQELQNAFTLALKEYAPEADITTEFPTADIVLAKYGDAVPRFATVWVDCVEKLTKLTANGLNPDDVPWSTGKYAGIYIFSDALLRSRFLKTLIKDEDPLNDDRRWKAEKLERRLKKVCQYVSGISHLIQRAKRLFPIPHRWVMDTFTGTGEHAFDLCDNAYDAISRGLDCPSLSPELVGILNNRFPAMLNNWERQQTVQPCIHAELRIILHLGLPSAIEPEVHPIGVSKRSCLCCTLWIKSHNLIFETEWMTYSSHGKPRANWALPGAACSYAIRADGRSSVDEALLNAVSTRLTDVLDQFVPDRRMFDEDGELDWRRDVVELARPYLSGIEIST